jgi:hypothetical protein
MKSQKGAELYISDQEKVLQDVAPLFSRLKTFWEAR